MAAVGFHKVPSSETMLMGPGGPGGPGGYGGPGGPAGFGGNVGYGRPGGGVTPRAPGWYGYGARNSSPAATPWRGYGYNAPGRPGAVGWNGYMPPPGGMPPINQGPHPNWYVAGPGYIGHSRPGFFGRMRGWFGGGFGWFGRHSWFGRPGRNARPTSIGPTSSATTRNRRVGFIQRIRQWWAFQRF